MLGHNPIDILEIFFVVVSGAALTRLARLRGGSGWPWVVTMVIGYIYARGMGQMWFGRGPDLLIGIAFIGLMFGAVFVFVGRGRRLESSWQCPNCEFFNEPTTLVCPCGYRFDSSGSSDASGGLAIPLQNDGQPTKQERHQVGRASGWLRQLWRGELGLAKTFWLYGVLVGTGLRVLSALLAGWIGPSPDIAFLYIPFGLATLAHFVVVQVAVWRASEVFSGEVIWKYLARATVVLGWIVAAFSLLAAFSE